MTFTDGRRGLSSEQLGRIRLLEMTNDAEGPYPPTDLVLFKPALSPSPPEGSTAVPREWIERLIGAGLQTGTGLLLSEGTYRLAASPQLLSKIASGEATVMAGAFGQMSAVHGAGGKIVDHVEYTKAGSPSAGADVLFGLMAIATQQHYLPEIRNSLRDIRQGVQSLQDAHWRQLNGSLTAIDKEAATLHRLLVDKQIQQEDRAHVMELGFRASEILESEREWVMDFVERLVDAAQDNKISPEEVLELLPDEGEVFVEEARILLRASVIRLAVLFLRAQYAADEGHLRLNTHIQAYERDLQEVMETLEIFSTALQALIVEIHEIELSAFQRKVSRRGLESKLESLALLGMEVEQTLEHHVLRQLQEHGQIGFTVDIRLDSTGGVAQASLAPAAEDPIDAALRQLLATEEQLVPVENKPSADRD